MRLKPYFGYWAIDYYPIGGSFKRAGKDGLIIEKIMIMSKSQGGCDAYGYTTDNKKVAFSLSDLE